MSVARRRCPGQIRDLHPTSATKLSSILYWATTIGGGTSPLHHPYSSACTLIGARQHRPFSSFTSPPSTPIFDKTSHPPPHTPNSFTFKRVQTPLTQLPSRVQAQITNSLSRVQARFAPQVFWSSGPRAFSHPGFCGLILHIVHYPIPGLYLTPSRIFGFTITYLFRYNTTQHMFLPYAGFNFFYLIFFFSIALRPTCVMLSRYISSLVAFDRMTLILFTFTSADPNHSLTLKRSDSTHHSIPRIQTLTHFSLS